MAERIDSPTLSNEVLIRHYGAVTEDWDLLAAYVRKERAKMGYPTLKAWARSLADKGSPLRLKTLSRIVNGERVGEDMRAALEDELGLPPLGATRIARGEDPFSPTPSGSAVDNSDQSSAAIFDLSPDQLVELHDFAARLAGRVFAGELLRWILGHQRTNLQSNGTLSTADRDVG